MSKTLVVYYSHSGNTTKVGEMISKVLNADKIEIKPVKKYTGGLWDVVDQWQVEYDNDQLRDIKENNIDLNQYDNIIVGSPNWGGTIATPIKTFLVKNDFSNKLVIPFATHGGGGVQNVAKDILKFAKKMYSVKPLVVAGRRVDEQTILDWSKGLGL